MDAKVGASKEWRPERSIGGKAQISVRYFHETGRFVFDNVDLKGYISLFDRKLLKWQDQGAERPEHNPTRERAEELLAEEEVPDREKRSWSPALDRALRSSTPVIRRPARNVEAEVSIVDDSEEVQDGSKEIEELARKGKAQPDARTVLKKLTKLRQGKEVSKSSAVPPAPEREKINKLSGHRARLAPRMPEFSLEELDYMAGKVPRLSPREKQVSSLLAEGRAKGEVATVLLLKSPLLENYLSTACNRLGIPRSSYARPYDRIGALKLVWERYKHLEAAREGNRKRLAKLKEELTDFEARLFETFKSLGAERMEVLFKALTGLMKER